MSEKTCKTCLHFDACSKWTDFPKQCGVPACGRYSGWISVEERLPDVDYYDYVLAWDGYNINFLHYSHRWQQWEDYCSMKKHHWNVTHWMPLPIPPKGDEGK